MEETLYEITPMRQLTRLMLSCAVDAENWAKNPTRLMCARRFAANSDAHRRVIDLPQESGELIGASLTVQYRGRSPWLICNRLISPSVVTGSADSESYVISCGDPKEFVIARNVLLSMEYSTHAESRGWIK